MNNIINVAKYILPKDLILYNLIQNTITIDNLSTKFILAYTEIYKA